MAQFDPNLHLRSLEELEAVILPRQNGCLKCEDKAPSCPPNCKDDEFCSFTIPTCNSCAQAICVKDDSKSSSSSGNGPNTGAIVGGVIGGLAVIAIATYLVWRFFIKTKRQSIIEESYIEDANEKTINEKPVDPRANNRDSTHTVHSIASTVLTRASNIIQIAYIPGVTNRATPTSPTLLVPPVPPIPMHASNSAASSPSPYEEPHFFVPGELRDSTYSGISGYSDRTSVARTSYAPRSSIAPSIASTIYGKNAVVVAPAQTGMRAKAAVVSVKSMGVGTGGSNTPPVPSVDYEKYARPKSRDSTFSVGSTFLNNANTATATPVQRVQVVRVGNGNGPKQVSVGSKSSSSSDVTSVPGTPPPPTASTTVTSVPTIAEDGPVDQGPFSDPPEPKPAAIRSTHSLSAVIEEATRRAASGPDRRSQRTSSYERGRSPFGDEHATKD
ncbi:Protein OPY2 [Colletotrichum spinosum]|uniref:Protein OPY2 n=1 Tax=Colletotrichum spinosum TaxID=1347390 RepID=A0A4R8PRA3_9PEZI|nr:Protein OPY2 [Colletotrichum spinosum]